MQISKASCYAYMFLKFNTTANDYMNDYIFDLWFFIFFFFWFYVKFHLDTFPTCALHYSSQIARSIRAANKHSLYIITK